MEVLQRKPLRLKYFFRTRQSKGRQHAGHELVVGHTVLFAAAYVVGLVPEVFRDPVLAYLCQQTAGVLYGSPFKHSSHRDMEGCRIHDSQNARIEDAALTQ